MEYDPSSILQQFITTLTNVSWLKSKRSYEVIFLPQCSRPIALPKSVG